jgi:5-formyltetrahydrofolate cyclo-ligase
MTVAAEQKKELRREMKKNVHEFCLFQSASLAASENLINSELYRNAGIVLAYMAMNEEADCFSVITKAIGDGKRVAVPRVKNGTNEMDFYIVDGTALFESQFVSGAFGIREPSLNLRIWNPEKTDGRESVLVIVPGLAFTKDGKRLGRGKGFYDRYLARLAACSAQQNTDSRISFKSVGFCFSCQIINFIPTDVYDLPLDAVVSESGLLGVC